MVVGSLVVSNERGNVMETIKKHVVGDYYYYEGEYFRCCGEYQDETYCVAHDTKQGCAFCSGYEYWNPCQCEEEV